MCFRAVANGACCRRTCCRRALGIITSIDGTIMKPLSGCTTLCTSLFVSRKAERQAHNNDHQQSERQGDAKRVASIGSQGLRRGQEDLRPQTAHSCRHAWLPLKRCRSSRRQQGRDGAREVLRRARRLFPFVERIVSDGGFQRTTPSFAWIAPIGGVQRSDNPAGSQSLLGQKASMDEVSLESHIIHQWESESESVIMQTGITLPSNLW